MVIFYSYVSLPEGTWIGSQRNCWLFPCFPNQRSLPWRLKRPQPLVTANEAMVHLPVLKGMIFHFASRQQKKPEGIWKMDETWVTATPPFTVPVALFWRNSWRLSHSWSAAVQRCQRKIRVWLLGRFGSRHPWLILPRSKKDLQFFILGSWD